jgi:SAM-dependent methyltransferase
MVRVNGRDVASRAGSVRGLVVGALSGFARTLERGATVAAYVAGGTLRLDDLRRHMERDWRHFGLHQSETDVSAGLFQWEKDFYLPHLRRGDHILVVGCGSGRDLLALRELGWEADGLEPVAACVALACQRLAKRGVVADVQAGAIETAPLPRAYDVFVFSWFCYSYIPQRAARVAALRRVKSRLAPGGRILVSYLGAQPPLRRLPWRLARLAARVSGADWRPEYGDVFSARHDSGSLHYEHRFQPGEIEAEARAAGLALAFHEQAGDGNAVLVAED